MRKGQNLALESVATFGLTLVAAVGIVQIFGNVNNSVISSAQETQAEVAADRIRSAVLQMSYSSEDERGYQEVQLSDQIGGEDYRVALQQDQILVFTEDNNFRQTFKMGRPGTNFQGSAEAGNVRIFKNSEGFVLRQGR
jgi:hypothetical protein